MRSNAGYSNSVLTYRGWFTSVGAKVRVGKNAVM